MNTGKACITGARYTLIWTEIFTSILWICICSSIACQWIALPKSQQETKENIRPPVKTYEYDFCECIGLTHSIVLNGNKVFVEFSADSDQEALKTLTSLDPFIRDVNEKGIL